MSYFYKNAREPVNSYTHFLGAVVFGFGAVLLFVKAFLGGVKDAATLLSLLVFALSVVSLYAASSAYHFSTRSPDVILHLRKLDHSMIYVLIAGTYTPILFHYLEAPKCYFFAAFMWIVAAAGILITLCWFGAPRWLTTVLYCVMGWTIIAEPSVLKDMSAGALWLLALGGVSYTAGGVIYALKKPNISPKLGFHELFHLFVLAGSLFHYLMVLIYIA